MREIKFRGKCIYTGKWLYGGIKFIGDQTFIIYNNGIVLDFNGEVYPESVGQYTGLKDKHGVDIYEGDLYKANTAIYEVRFVNGAFCGGLPLNENTLFAPLGFKADGNDIAIDDDMTFIEVIGNIYQNPELIK